MNPFILCIKLTDSGLQAINALACNSINKPSELELALAAHEASKAAAPSRPIRPVRPPGVIPPRRKAPADPFIKKRLLTKR